MKWMRALIEFVLSASCNSVEQQVNQMAKIAFFLFIYLFLHFYLLIVFSNNGKCIKTSVKHLLFFLQLNLKIETLKLLEWRSS